MQAPDADHLFRSDGELDKDAARQAKASRLKDAGDPIKLASKPLDMAVRREKGKDVAYVAESGFAARKVDIQVLYCSPRPKLPDDDMLKYCFG